MNKNKSITVFPATAISADSVHGSEAMGVALNLVTAYLGANKVDPADLAGLVRDVFSAVNESMPSGEAPASKERFPQVSKEPVVPVKKSIQPDGIVCLIDGRKMLMLKRHLRANYGMSFKDYKEHFGLPNDYPSVAPCYSNEKRVVAKAQGLGVTIDKTPRAQREAALRGRGRPRKALAA